MRRWLSGAWLVVAAAVLCVPGGPAAKESGAAPDNNLKRRIQDWRDRQDWVGEGSYGSVTLDEEAFEQIFGHRSYSLVRFGWGWYPAPNLCLVGVAGGMYNAGHSVGSISGKSSGEAVELYVLPLQWNVRYRFAFVEDQFMVPSVWAGVDYWYFQELNEFRDNVDGDKSGWHWGADVAFLLDKLDPEAAHHMKMDYGIDGTYLVAGYEALMVGEAEDGLKFSGSLYSIGLRFEVAGK
ncbi:MAG TPA: hypothetical protein VM658_01075 [bacterium]|nr:hypothetical protein [bacterium]